MKLLQRKLSYIERGNLFLKVKLSNKQKVIQELLVENTEFLNLANRSKPSIKQRKANPTQKSQ